MKSRRSLTLTEMIVSVALVTMSVLAMAASEQQPTVTGSKQLLQQRELTAPESIKKQLQAFRAEIQKKNLKYTVGYTKAADMPRQALLGDKDDPKLTREYRVKVNQAAAQRIKIDSDARAAFLKKNPAMAEKMPDVQIAKLNCTATRRSFDWNASKKVTPAKEQSCGNCWAFAATGAYEASHLRLNGKALNASEQYINDCATSDHGTDAGSCDGGLASKALEHFVRVGGAYETVVPYTGTDRPCTNPATPLDAVAWGFVDPSIDHPTIGQIKAALCTYGPLTTRMRVVSNAIFFYTGGVYSESVASDAAGDGHAVVIVGWNDDKSAWRIKNSWPDWGEDGFGWIAYGSNRIGRHTAWIKSKSVFYAITDPRFVKPIAPIEKLPEPITPIKPLPAKPLPAAK